MKDKIKRFFIDKKELLVFIAVVVVVFATVITIASLALSDAPVSGDDIINTTPDNTDKPSTSTKPDKPSVNTQPVVQPKFMLPIKGEYEVVRTYFDTALSDEELVSAIIQSGSYMIESKGMSYAKSDNKTFDVCAIYQGTVTAVEESELNGVCVTISHTNGVVSIYSSLSDVSLKVNDKVSQGQTVGKASESLFDVEAGVHVHLEVKVNGSFVNPTAIFGKEISEVVVEK